MCIYMVVDLKVLVSSVYDDDPEHIKISFGESFFSSWRKFTLPHLTPSPL